jgi:hypothetical protein
MAQDVDKHKKESRGRFDFGDIIWWDGIHYVKNTLAVRVDTSSASAFNGSIHY